MMRALVKCMYERESVFCLVYTTMLFNHWFLHLFCIIFLCTVAPMSVLYFLTYKLLIYVYFYTYAQILNVILFSCFSSNIKQIVAVYGKSLVTWQNLPKFKTCLTFDSTALLLPFHSTNTGTNTERCVCRRFFAARWFAMEKNARQPE